MISLFNNVSFLDDLTMSKLMFVLGLSGLMTSYVAAKESEQPATAAFLKQLADSREERLTKIQASLFANEINTSHLGNEIKKLIQLYKDHLHQLEVSQKLMDNNPLLKEINLLLARLEKGEQYPVQDKMQANQCYSLISAIESIFEKLENPASSVIALEMPATSNAIIAPLKKLQGEKIPYSLTASQIKKDKEEAEELPLSTSAHFKLATLIPEESELELEKR